MNPSRRLSPGLYAFHAPALLLYATFILAPFAGTIFLSLHRWDGFGEMEWAGGANYFAPAEEGGAARGVSVTTDSYLRAGLLNNVRYLFVTLVSEVGLGLAMAALLVRCRRGEAVYRLALSIPLMIALVATAVLWRQILAKNGLINGLLEAIGLGSLTRDWVGAQWIVWSVGAISGWVYAGFFMLIFYAALKRIPAELREAAFLDGAGEWSIFARIELPLLRPTIAVCVLLCSTGAFRAFDLFYILVGSGISRTSEVASTWLVKNAFTYRHFGYASAIATVVVVVVVALAATLNRWAARERELEF